MSAGGSAGAPRRALSRGSEARSWSAGEVRETVARGRWVPARDAVAAAGIVPLARRPNTTWVTSALAAAVATPIVLNTVSEYGQRATAPGAASGDLTGSWNALVGIAGHRVVGARDTHPTTADMGEGGSMRETCAWRLGDYLAVLRRRAWIVVGATVVGATVLTAVAAGLPRPVTTSFSEGEAGD
jgi:hypothetical protein